MILRTERSVKHAVKQILKEMNIWHYMPPASVYGRRGIPDFVCCMDGLFIGIEAKSVTVGRKGLSPTQLIESRGILASGGEYIVVYNDETLNKMTARLQELIK